MTRKALRFGRHEHLIGVIHEPTQAPRELGVLLWNTGISHRIGPFRIHVDLAEHLTRLGFTVLRFDLSKLGDSELAEQDSAIQDVFTRDIHDAAQLLEDRYKLKQLISIGICSGAVDAWYHARQDPRIRGLVMVDSFVYPTLRHEATFFFKRLFSARRWQRLIKNKMLGSSNDQDQGAVNDFLDPNYPSLALASADTQKLVDRGTELLVLYTGGFHPWYSYKNQFRAMLRGVQFGGKLQLEFWPEVDHLFTMLEDRARFIQLVSNWARDRFKLADSDLPVTVQDKAEALEPIPLDGVVSPLPPAGPSAVPAAAAKALTAADHQLPQSLATAAADTAELARLQKQVLEVMNSVLFPASLELDDSFFDFGGNSVLAIKSCATLTQQLGYHVPITLLYTHLRARDFAKALHELAAATPAAPEATPEKKPERSEANGRSEAIAIIGFACKVPGARNIDEFWSMIREGREGISHFKPEELDPTLPPEMTRHRNYVAARGVIEGDRFDHEFFGINRKEATILDPQQRVLLETCWQALEHAGWAHRRQSTRIATYAGVGSNTYLMRNLMLGHAAPHSEDEAMAEMGNDKDFIATHIAYYLDLKGPAVSVHTACSTSLVAVVEGIKTLLADEADIALAGAATVTAPMASGHLYQEGGIFTRDGHCRPFAANASGTMFSDGSAVVVLKRLDKALADGDPIHAVIQGWALNNDGRNKSSFMAPSVEGQAQAIAKAYERSGWSPRSVSYTECHGTATPIGDPIEIEGLRKVFQSSTGDQQFCALGSVKANIGHLTAAAGTISLIKAALVLQHGEIPPALHAYPLNPELRLEQSPFHIPKSLQPWPREALRRAGVSSFGVGGTNAHVLLEAGPQAARTITSNPLDPWLTLSWSARDAQSCQRLLTALASQWQKPDNSAHDLCYTMGRFRARFRCRQSLTGRNPDSWQQAIASLRKNPPLYPEKTPPIILVFPGQGSQYPAMGRELARAWPRFSRHYQSLLSAFEQRFGLQLAAALDEPANSKDARIHTTLYTQPALFCLEWALAQSLIDCGLPVTAVMGHSIGELTAAAVAGVLRLDDAVHMVYERAKAMQAARPGQMLAVRASRESLEQMLPRGISICVINSAESCVIGGETESIEAFQAVLKSKRIAFKALETSHAFHSVMMDDVLVSFHDAIQQVPLQRPLLPIISTVTGSRLLDDEACSLSYWVNQIRQPVNFLGAVQHAATHHEAIFLELGPKDALSRYISQILRGDSRWPALALLPRSAANGGEESAFTDTISELANYGLQLFVPQSGRVLPAPVYPFEGERLWLEPLAPPSAQPGNPAARNPVGTQRQEPLSPARNPWLQKLTDSLLQISGIEREAADPEGSWVSLGLDSLILTQWSLKMQKEWGINMNLTMLQNELQNLQALAGHLQNILPQNTASATSPSPSTVSSDLPALATGPLDPQWVSVLLQQQISLMSKQLELLTGFYSRQTQAQTAGFAAAEAAASPVAPAPDIPSPEPHAVAPAQEAVATMPQFLNRLVHEGEIEFATDHGVQRMPRYRGAFLALDSTGQPGLFIENPDQAGEYWQVAGE